MTTDLTSAAGGGRAPLDQRVAEYFELGGFFNPELMAGDATAELIRDLWAAVTAQRAAPPLNLRDVFNLDHASLALVSLALRHLRLSGTPLVHREVADALQEQIDRSLLASERAASPEQEPS